MKVRQIGGREAPSLSFSWLAPIARGLGTMVRWFWLPAGVVAAALYWGSPNVLWSYTYVPVGKSKTFTSCTFLGIDGYRVVPATDGCPVVAFFPLNFPDLSPLWRN